MSKVQLQGNASGTGVFTIASPNSNIDRTLTLPDNTGTILSSASTLSPSQLGSQFSVSSSAPSGSFVMNANGAVTTPYQPAFEAYNSSDTTYNGTAQSVPVVYNATYRNTGSHYNTANGVFTAPVAGYYAFFAGGYTSVPPVSQMWCIQNGARTVSMAIKNNSGSPGDTISGSAIVYLSAGDTFGVFVYSTSAANPTTLISNPYHTFFKGFLLG